MTRPDPVTWLSVKEAAAELRLSPSTVRHHIRTGTLPAQRGPDGSWRVERGLMQRWITGSYEQTRDLIAARGRATPSATPRARQPRRDHDVAGWVEQRQRGRAVTEIARDAGVSQATVSRLTNPHGPFRRTDATPAPVVEDWVRARRAGTSVRELARSFEVDPGTVYRETASSGPFPRAVTGPLATADRPTDETITAWVKLRRDGLSIRHIAEQAGVPLSRVATYTRDHEPFPIPTRLAPGRLSFRAVTQRVGVGRPALQRRLDAGELPPPAGTTTSGQPYWLVDDIDQWLATTTLPRCPDCGAPVTQLRSHQRVHHRENQDRRSSQPGGSHPGPELSSGVSTRPTSRPTAAGSARRRGRRGE